MGPWAASYFLALPFFPLLALLALGESSRVAWPAVIQGSGGGGALRLNVFFCSLRSRMSKAAWISYCRSSCRHAIWIWMASLTRRSRACRTHTSEHAYRPAKAHPPTDSCGSPEWWPSSVDVIAYVHQLSPFPCQVLGSHLLVCVSFVPHMVLGPEASAK